MAPSRTSSQTTAPLWPCPIPELVHLTDQTSSSTHSWNKPLVKPTDNNYNILTVDSHSPPQSHPLNPWAEQLQDDRSGHSAPQNHFGIAPSIIKDRRSHSSPGYDVADDSDYLWEDVRQHFSHGTLSRLEQRNNNGKNFERCLSLDNHNHAQHGNSPYLPSPDKFSAYPLYLRQQAGGIGESTLPLLPAPWSIEDGDTELDSVPLCPDPVPPRKGSDTPYPTNLIPQRTLPPGAQDPASQFPKVRSRVVGRVTGSVPGCNSLNSNVQNVLVTSDEDRAPIKPCLKQSSSNVTNYPSPQRTLQDSQEESPVETAITPNQIDFVSKPRPTLPTPSHTPAQSWSENASAHIISAGVRAYDSNTPLHIAKQRYATIEEALCYEIKKCRKGVTGLVSKPRYPDVNIQATSSGSQLDTYSSDDFVSYVESPTYTQASPAETEDEIRAISLLSEPEVFTAIEASIIPIGPHSVRMRSIRRTKGSRTLNGSQTGQQHQPAHNDSGISMGLDNQKLSQIQNRATGNSENLSSRHASVHLREQQKQLHQHRYERRQSVDQFAGISCQSPLPPEHREHEGSYVFNKQCSASPDIGTGSSPAIRGRKDGLPYSPKFIERMELNGPAIWSSPNPSTANIADREYEGEVYPENVESQDQTTCDESTNVDSPSANNSAIQEDRSSSNKTSEQTPEASSPVGRHDGAENNSEMGNHGGLKGKLRNMKERIKKEWYRTACEQKKACIKLKRKFRRLRGCDAP